MNTQLGSEMKAAADLQRAPDDNPGVEPRPASGQRATADFYRVRSRIYFSLLAFVVVAGLPVVSVPALRHRLSDRVQTLREAMGGGRIKPVIVQVGENKEPFPSDYEKKSAPPSYPKLPPYFAATQGFGGSTAGASPAAAPTPSIASSAPLRKMRTIRIPQTQMDSETQAPSPRETQQAAADQGAADVEPQPKYQQGLLEKEAYDLLLKSNATLSGMVGGSNLVLRFKSWDALKRDEDTYWVRVTFVSASDSSNVEYIWQVKLLAKEVVPLSYNARSLASP